MNTGASTNGVSAGNTNGLITVAVTSSVIANFGIDRLPTALATNASYVNTGTAVTVPGLLGIDPEQGKLGDLHETVIDRDLAGQRDLGVQWRGRHGKPGHSQLQSC